MVCKYTGCPGPVQWQVEACMVAQRQAASAGISARDAQPLHLRVRQHVLRKRWAEFGVAKKWLGAKEWDGRQLP